MSNRKAALTLIIVTGLMIGIVFADAGSRSSGPSVPVKPRTTLNSPPSYGSLANFWNGNAYFERSRYASSVSLDESAPLPRPDLGPNVIYTYYRMKVPAGTAQIARARDAIALMVSTDGGASYQAPSDVNEPVVDVGSDICSWDAFNVIAPSVVNVGGTFYMVYEGANLQLGSSTITGCDPLAHYETSGDIGLATSTNGKIWTKYPGTNLGLLLTHNISPYSFECNNIGAPSVTWLNSQFYIFFHGNCGGSGDPKGVQNLDLRNKIGMVHGNNIYGLQSQPVQRRHLCLRFSLGGRIR